MRVVVDLATVLVAAALAYATPAAAQSGATPDEIQEKCGGPDNPQPPGPDWKDFKYPGVRSDAVTPATYPDVIMVGAPDTNCLVTNFPGRILVISSGKSSGRYWIPGAIDWEWAAGNDYEVVPVKPKDVQPEFVRLLDELTGGDKIYPLLIYGESEKDNSVLMLIERARLAGYRFIFWNRTGILGWVNAGYDSKRPPSPQVVAVQKAEQSWKTCAQNAAFDSSGVEAQALDRVMVACSSETQAIRSARAKFLPAAVIVFEEQSELKSWFSSIFEFRKRADREAKWLGDQGIGIPASQQMNGYEFCWYNMAHKKVTYVQSPRPAAIRRMSDVDLEAYNRRLHVNHSKRYREFLVELERRFGALTPTNYLHEGACYFAKTQSAAVGISANPARFTDPERSIQTYPIKDPGF